MTATEPTWIDAPLPDPDKLADAWSRVFVSGLDALQAAAERSVTKPTSLPYDPTAPARAFADFTTTLLSNPLAFWSAQQQRLQEWGELWTTATSRVLGQEAAPLIAPERGDRRFNDPAWSELPTFDYLKQAYLLTTKQVLDAVSSSDLDPAARTRADFYARQFLNALSPANFAFSNPEALRKALETGGVSLLSGLANMLADAAHPSGLVQRRADENFEVGVNIAATPGKVVFQNQLMQLLQYAPSTETVFKRPILYIPPLVNKYYLLDLQPKSSLIKWLVDQGHTVFAISWVNPGPELAERGVSDYINEGPIAALKAIEKATGERSVDCFAFCMGGVLLSMAAGYLATTKDSDRVGSLTMIGTMLDTTESGEWATFYEPQHMDAFRAHLEETGVIHADKLQGLFSAVRANDLIWPSVVNHYLLDRAAPASDLLFWFADGARIPKAFLIEYSRVMLRENNLRNPGGVKINGTAIDLRQVTCPVSVISLKDDHVSGWQATYAGAKLFGGKTRFLLGGSGHNAGLINPPAANKHGFWSNDDLAEAAEQWFDAAEKNPGSWWPNWQQWLVRENGGERVPARIPGSGKLKAIEDAPGSYVLVK